MRGIERGAVVRFLAVAVPSLALATVAVAVLEDVLDVPNPSAIYLVAVVATAVVSGTWGAAAASVAAFLLYNFLFVEPRYTFTVANLAELTNLFLLLFVGFVVGQLAARQRARAEDALAREREALALFKVSRELATRASTPAVLPVIAGILAREAAMDRVWISLGVDARERVAADAGGGRTATGHRPPPRAPADARAIFPRKWARVHRSRQTEGAGRRWLRGVSRPHRGRIGDVRFDLGGPLDSSRVSRRGARPGSSRRRPTRSARRCARIGSRPRHRRRRSRARATRSSPPCCSPCRTTCARRSRRSGPRQARFARTACSTPDEQQESADAIDREVEYLNRLVTNLLDLSAGSRPERCAPSATPSSSTTSSAGRSTGCGHDSPGAPLEVDLEAPPVEVDPVFLDEAVTNVLENALKYTPPAARRCESRRARSTATSSG